MAEYAPVVRSVGASLKDGRYARATSGREPYGLVCPLCGGGKTRQALRCSVCYHGGARRSGPLLSLRLRRYGSGITHAARIPRRLVVARELHLRRTLVVDALVTARCGAGLRGLKVVMSTPADCLTCRRLEGA